MSSSNNNYAIDYEFQFQEKKNIIDTVKELLLEYLNMKMLKLYFIYQERIALQ